MKVQAGLTKLDCAKLTTDSSGINAIGNLVHMGAFNLNKELCCRAR